jgi:hypothetical protein
MLLYFSREYEAEDSITKLRLNLKVCGLPMKINTRVSKTYLREGQADAVLLVRHILPIQIYYSVWKRLPLNELQPILYMVKVLKVIQIILL